MRPVVWLLLVLLPLGCAATARRGEPVAGAFRPDTPEIARGRAVFMHKCQPCHPGGDAGMAPSLNDKPLPGFLIKLQVRAGFGSMPAFPRASISDAELDDLVAYMKALKAHGPSPAPVP